MSRPTLPQEYIDGAYAEIRKCEQYLNHPNPQMRGQAMYMIDNEWMWLHYYLRIPKPKPYLPRYHETCPCSSCGPDAVD